MMLRRRKRPNRPSERVWIPKLEPIRYQTVTLTFEETTYHLDTRSNTKNAVNDRITICRFWIS